MYGVNTFSNVRCLKFKDPRRELWALDETIIRFTLPRLKVFRDYTKSYPVDDNIKNFEDWQLTIDKMIFGMERYILDASDEQAIEGMNLFFKYFTHLLD